jgi:septation ring formation regulator EzrA
MEVSKVEQTSIRLAPEISKMLHAEAEKISASVGETVTVSDLIRACIGEKFPRVCARITSERAAFSELRDEVAALKERVASHEEGTQKLVENLSKIFPLLATREQVDSLTEAIAAVMKAMSQR